MREFTFRPVTAGDKVEILTFTEKTWESGDYIQWVFDEWLADEAGRFLAAIDMETGKVAGIDKLTMLSPSEGWFEGIRVNPEFRGNGLAGLMQRHLVSEGKAFGAKHIRFITIAGNAPIHKIAYRDGFTQGFSMRHWQLKLPTEKSSREKSTRTPFALRPASAAEVASLYGWWVRSGAYNAVGGLIERRWSFSKTSEAEWESFALRGELLIPEGTDVGLLKLPPPLVIYHATENDGEPIWALRHVAATGAEWPQLALGLRSAAEGAGVTSVSGLLPDTALLHSAFLSAGFTTGSDSDVLVLFSLDLAS